MRTESSNDLVFDKKTKLEIENGVFIQYFGDFYWLFCYGFKVFFLTCVSSAPSFSAVSPLSWASLYLRFDTIQTVKHSVVTRMITTDPARHAPNTM